MTVIRRLDMRSARPVTALAVDAFGQLLREDRPVKIRIYPQRACVALRIAVVAEHALRLDGAEEVLLVLSVVARTHCPVALAFRVPGHRELDQLPIRGSMQEGARMIARADYVVDPLFRHVRLFAIKATLRPALEELAIPFDHFVAHAGKAMIDSVGSAKVFRGIRRRGLRERPSHSRFAVGCGDIPVTTHAFRRIDVVRAWCHWSRCAARGQ